MAVMIKPFHACALILIVSILAIETFSAEGRILVEKSTTIESQIVADGVIVGTEDARPTAPGHSPGVGHSMGNKGVDKNV